MFIQDREYVYNIPKLEVINTTENIMENDPEITKTDQREIY
jgi:hypothetical protein